jgi:hypothetical protein
MASLGESTRIVQLKVRLLGLSPMIWRRVLVLISVSLRELHGILQVSMGWKGIHLYYFDIYAVHYGAFELDAESPDIPLSRFRLRAKDRFAYLYDMGDYWEHEVRIEQFLDRNSKKTYPVCIGGSGACPPEDCGGPPGYLERLEEAMGWDAWSDRDLVVGFISGVLEGRSAGSLSEDEREAVEGALERMEQRQPFLDTTFSRRTVNEAFRAGRHLQMMRQQLI